MDLLGTTTLVTGMGHDDSDSRWHLGQYIGGANIDTELIDPALLQSSGLNSGFTLGQQGESPGGGQSQPARPFATQPGPLAE
ncbi:hypothetical protein SAMD00023353_10400010 [Rosellinia necatrix]|uniref:Uncharacterized protein n=1 Tax=Rosellinia necatrix TaxID=77044 RepID=A0A1S8ABA8_ROSNE|nr:hypothetical protein SAMD00023353_10400010 [Rosellinia necatrix]